MSASDGMMLWTNDYLADTQHLTTVQHGAYLLILMAMWRAGGDLPNDEVRLARTARLAMDKWRKIAPAVLELFTVEGDRITQKRLQQELKHTLGRMEKRRAAGRAGGEAKALKSHDAGLANATLPPQQKAADAPGNRNGMEEDKKDSRTVARATRPVVGQSFEEFWSKYPKRDGSNPRAPAEKKFKAFVTSGVDPAAIIAGADAYAREVRSKGNERTPYVAQAVTWLNQRRWEDYTPSALPNGGQPVLAVVKSKHGDVVETEHGRRVYVKANTPEWDAWGIYLRREKRQVLPIPDVDGGRPFPDRWPPDHPNAAKDGGKAAA